MSYVVYSTSKQSDVQLTMSSAMQTDLPDLSTGEKAALLEAAEAVVMGNTVAALPTAYQHLTTIPNGVIAVLREDGEFRGVAWAQEENLYRSVQAAVAQALAEEYSKISNKDQVYVHLFVFGPEKELDKEFELGLHGVHMRSSSAEIYIRPSFQTERNYDAEKYWEVLCDQIDMKAGCQSTSAAHTTYAPVLHFGQSRDKSRVVDFYRGKELESFAPITRDTLLALQQPAEQRLLDNVKTAGDITYVYNPSNGTYSDNNNMIRQLM
ncbi:MAG: hypothetical protein H6765_01210 [Candidatus Peribacteria bacterium]|nr:MAG: hypothetical protein H6765_01210 [Candidatus Peribacteria bacterium]